MRNEVNPHAVAGTDKRREDAYQLIDSGERAHLPMELSIQRRGVLIGNGARVEYKTVAPEKGAERQIGVVEQRIGRDGRGQLAPHGINTPRARLYRVDAGVVQPDPFLVAPVQAHVGCLLLLVAEKVDMAARRSHRRIAETPYQALQTARALPPPPRRAPAPPPPALKTPGGGGRAHHRKKKKPPPPPPGGAGGGA